MNKQREKMMNAPHKHAEMIKAWANGVEIEYLAYVYGAWVWKPICKGWAWDNEFVKEYRIKPEPLLDWQQRLVDAVKAGKTVEYKTYSGKWQVSENFTEIADSLNCADDWAQYGLLLLSDPARYRIKQEPVVRWLWALKSGAMSVSLYTEEEAELEGYKIKLEWSRTEFPE